MTYVSRPSYVLLQVASGGVGSYCVALTEITTNHAMGSLDTPAYHGTPTLALVDLICRTRVELSGVFNMFDASGGGYIGLNDGSGTFSCGDIPTGVLWTQANTTVYSEYRIKGLTNIANQIKPSTHYNCSIMHGKLGYAGGINLYNPYLELNLYFNL